MSPTVTDISTLFKSLAQDHKLIGHVDGSKTAFFGFDALELAASDLSPKVSYPLLSLTLPNRSGMQNRYNISQVGNMTKNNIFTFSVLKPVSDFNRDYEEVMSATTSIVDDIIIRLQQLSIEGKSSCAWYSDIIFDVVESFKVGPIGPNLYGFAATLSLSHIEYITPTKNTTVWQ